jgi:septum formation protein
MAETMNDLFDDRRLILASSSPRRRELLHQAGYKFIVIPPLTKEPRNLDIASPLDYAKHLAHFKAREIARLHRCDIVIGADTIVACKGKILGKPACADQARAMLAELSAGPHVVITAIALLGPGPASMVRADETRVTMRPMSQAEIEEYIRSGEWRGKAGAYAIQETADRFIIKLEGSKTNVVGLPMELLGRMLQHQRR